MSDPATMLQTLLTGEIGDSLFPLPSRYHGTETTVWTTATGREVAYLRRRFVPSPKRFDSLGEHTIVEGDRLDNLATKHLGDPELYWRICDANGAIRPDELTDEPGRTVRITLPEGIPSVQQS